jgi:hypothetical protein
LRKNIPQLQVFVERLNRCLQETDQ